ncbi:ABC transporter permease subunit [Lentzea sp. NBRC 102530]|uniref:ABC transporter permease subunit n=1 Tax=Lentzea sp. NBRC 102530 TaxID=3032201 RepID=UPI0024A1916C|nr:ABC transporter permease subunit [Lentzea sp. NBRC 102530]GLY51405.1 ABC transporter permease [Lentzea sp. NBRC 102530]
MTESRPRRITTKTVVLAVGGLAVALLLFGPLLAPHAATTPVAPPYAPPSAATPFGTDHLGRDVLSRWLHGGLPLVLTSLAAALTGAVAGAAAGLTAALTRSGWVENAVLRPLDAIAAVPPILVLLLTLIALPSRAGLVLAVTLAAAPLTARVTMAAAAQVAGRAHVEAAVARGENWAWLVGREVLPLIAATVLADAGMRFVSAVHLVAAAGFLGLGVSDSDWGLMIVDALPGAALQPWALAVPVIGVAALAIGANLLSDRVVRTSRGLAG